MVSEALRHCVVVKCMPGNISEIFEASAMYNTKQNSEDCQVVRFPSRTRFPVKSAVYSGNLHLH